MAAILGNMEDLQGAYESAMNSNGSAMRENEAYLDSIQGRIDLFTNSVQTMWMNFIDTDAVKMIVDIGTMLVNWVDNLGVIQTILMGIVGYFTIIKNTDLTSKSMSMFGKNNKINLLKGQALDDEISAFNDALAQGSDAFDAYKLKAKEAGNGMDILADRVGQGTVQLKNGKVSSQDYTAALQNQSKAAVQAANKQKLMNVAIGLTSIAVSTAISAIKSYLDDIKTVEERYDELQSSITTAENDISSLNTELESVQEQIDALSNKPLTLTEADELKKLKEQSKELQSQKEIRESMLGMYKTQEEAASLAMFNEIIQTTAANQEKAAKTGKTWGKVLGTIADIALVAGGVAVTGLSGGLATAVGGAMIGAGISGTGSSLLGEAGEWIGNKTEQVSSLTEWYESYTNAINEATKQASEAEAEYLTNITDDNYDKWQKKLEASNNLQQDFYNNLEKLQEYIDNLDYNDTTKSTIDEFNSLLTKISLQGIGDDVQSQISYIQSLEDEFTKLSKGVDENGKNIALSTEEYAKYQSILSQILGLTPSLIQGYNDEGNAIVNKNNLIAESIELLKEQQKIEAQKLTSDENILSAYKSSNKNYNAQIDAVKETTVPAELAYSGRKKNKNGTISTGYVHQIDKYIADVIDVEKKWDQTITEYIIDNADAIYENLDEIIERSKQDKDGWLGLTDEQSASLLSWLEQIRIGIEYADGAMAGFKQTLSTVAQGSDYYNQLSGSHISFINDYIDSLGDLSNLTDEEVLLIRNNIRSLTDKIGQDEELQDLIENLFEVDPNLSAKGYISAIDGIFQQLVNKGVIDEKTKTEMFEQFIPDAENIDVMIAEVQRALNDEYDNMAQNLSIAELKIAYKFVSGKDDGSVSGADLQAELNKNKVIDITAVKTYSELTSQITSYDEVLLQTSEIITNNTKVTQEYKDALGELGIDETELSACFDDNNKLVVKNAKELNRLVKASKNNIANNIKLSKTQAQLDYYELYKEMRQFTNGQKITNQSTLTYVNSLYSQMTALEKTIAKYSMLEAKLLGASNAYDKLADAQAADTETDYGSKAEELVNVLANAFNTGLLGIQAAQVAIAGLIPEDVIDKSKTLDEQMQQIYEYFTGGEVSKLFTIEFDDNGEISSVEMTKENVESFTQSLIDADKVFHGSWDQFTLDESITSLDDFAEKLGVTKEVAFAYLTELEKFDIGWLGGDYETLLDQLMSGDLEYAINKNIQDLADLEYQVANGLIGQKEYAKRYSELTEAYAQNQDKARESISKWSDTTTQIESAQTEVDTLREELDRMKESGASEQEIKLKQDELDTAINNLYSAQSLLKGLSEPTQLTLKIASEDVQSEIDTIKEQLNKEGIVIDTYVRQNSDTGKYEVVEGVEYTGEVDLQNFATLLNEQQTINTLLESSATDTNTYLSNIEDTVSNIYSLLGGKNPSRSDGEDTAGSAATGATSDSEEEAARAKTEEEARTKAAEYHVAPDEVYKDFFGDKSSLWNHLALYVNNGQLTLDTGILKELFYHDEEKQKEIIDKAKARGDIVIEEGTIDLENPLGLNGSAINAYTFLQALTRMGANPYVSAGTAESLPSLGFYAGIFSSFMQSKGWTRDDVYSYLQQLSQTTDAEGLQEIISSDNWFSAPNLLTDSLEKVIIERVDQGPNVDLKNRPIVPFDSEHFGAWIDYYNEIVNNANQNTAEDVEFAKEQLAILGRGDSEVTIYPQIYTNEYGGQAIVLTPILPDGTVLSPDALESYAQQILGGQDIEPDITLGYFWDSHGGDTASENAEQLAESLHEAQVAYYNLSLTNPDPLGINDATSDIDSFTAALDSLGIKYKNSIGHLFQGGWFDGKRDIEISIADLTETLRSKGWTNEAIKAYCEQLSENANVEGVNIEIVGIELVDEMLNELDEREIGAKEFPVTANGIDETKQQLDELDNYALSGKSITTEHKIVTTNEIRTVHTSGGGRYTVADGTAHADGTAYKDGNWGAPASEEALVGELGPELVVRNGHWFTVGDNGAEFTDIQRGDIIFNHKQTEDLLSKGYVSGRGKAFAEGNAYAGIDTWDDAYNGLYKDYSNTGSEIKDAAGKLSKAAEDISDSSDEFKEVFDWIEVRIEEITEDIDLKSAKLENAVGSTKQNAIIDDMIALNKKLYDNLTAGAARYDEYAAKLLEKVPAEYRKAAQDGSIAIESFTGEVGEETLNAIQDYRDWVQKGADLTQQAEETLTEIANLAKQAIDNIASDYENKSSIPNIKIEQLEAYNALIETTKGAESAKVYQAMIKENNKNIKILEQQRDKMQAELNAQVEAGNIKKYSQAWYDAINDIAAVDTEIIELTTDTANYQDTINELHWEHFDNLISRFEAISDEANNLIDILGSKDLVDKDSAEWTDEGITALGLYAQQMEVAEMQAKKYEEEIKYLNKNWKSLGYTEQEYVEKLEELKSGQYDAIKAYNDTKDAIVDLNQERIDAIKDGIEKEIDAYEELIEKKKELLDSEKD